MSVQTRPEGKLIILWNHPTQQFRYHNHWQWRRNMCQQMLPFQEIEIWSRKNLRIFYNVNTLQYKFSACGM